MAQQTAVEWLMEQLPTYGYNVVKVYPELFEQAKEMEKEQMKGMYVEGAFAKMRHFDGKEFVTAEEYYNKTYGSENKQ